MIYLGADHAGFKLKEEIKKFLREEKQKFEDLGNEEFDPGDDYPDYAHPVAKKVAETGERGILFCGNAQGVCILANKVKRIRAAVGADEYVAKTSRTDDDSNILCLPGRIMTADEAKKIVKSWLETPFSGADRHVRRLKKIQQIEDGAVSTDRTAAASKKSK